MTSFEKALKRTLGIEGGFSNDKRDSGGATRYGITEAKARAHGYTGAMADLPLELATSIYKDDFWDLLRLDRVAAVSEPVALEMFDTAVNCGVGVAGRFLQRVLNVLNREQRDYADLVVDGLVGGSTVAALSAYLKLRSTIGERVLVRVLNGQQSVYYIELAERRSKDEAFTFGWFINRVLEEA